jgi:hypothetical protein
MFAAAGVTLVARRLEIGGAGLRWLPFAVALAALVHSGWWAPAKRCGGFAAVVADVLQRPENAHAVFLISSDATGEGMFIAETAMHESAPAHHPPGE